MSKALEILERFQPPLRAQRQPAANDTSAAMESLWEKTLWVAKVKPKWHPPEGLFTKDAKTIATTLCKASKSLKQAMARLNFYINRAGKNLSPERRKELEKAKELLHKVCAAKAAGEALEGAEMEEIILTAKQFLPEELDGLELPSAPLYAAERDEKDLPCYLEMLELAIEEARKKCKRKKRQEALECLGELLEVEMAKAGYSEEAIESLLGDLQTWLEEEGENEDQRSDDSTVEELEFEVEVPEEEELEVLSMRRGEDGVIIETEEGTYLLQGVELEKDEEMQEARPVRVKRVTASGKTIIKWTCPQAGYKLVKKGNSIRCVKMSAAELRKKRMAARKAARKRAAKAAQISRKLSKALQRRKALGL